MSQRKISKQQASRIADKQSATSEHGDDGLLISRFGKQADVEDSNGHVYRCHLRQHLGLLVAGDRVSFIKETADTGIITTLLPRDTVLGRTNRRGQTRPVAANVSQMLITFAPEPALQAELIDSYCVAAEFLNIKPVLVHNKSDMLGPKAQQTLQAFLEIYHQLGYDSVYVSAESQTGLNDLIHYLDQQTSVFVGQSGVGKSSLIQALLPDHVIAIGDISHQAGLGRHTTTISRLYHLPQGGDLIDSPGIREFGLWHLEQEAITRNFKEFKPYLNQCKYRNCKHQSEPECAISQAVQEGIIHASRYQSWQALINKHSLTGP